MMRFYFYIFILCFGFLSVFKCESKKERQELLLIDQILVYKSKRQLQLLSKNKIVKEYKIALGGSPIGHKEQEGDQRTPEGHYKIDFKRTNSQFYKALRISYPNAQDRLQAKKQNVSPGGDIYIHGLPKSFSFIGKAHLNTDWTLGCLALTNQEIDEFFDFIPLNTPIVIYP
ncbi:MAG: L,D-transpeptidase family protein [Janthinobacterium lividum]